MPRRWAEVKNRNAAEQTQVETSAFRRGNDASGVVVEGVRHMEKRPVTMREIETVLLSG